MAQRAASAGGVSRSSMPNGYADPKQFDKRVTTETKKVKELLAAIEKGRQQLENERKAYCDDFKKFLIAYAADQTIHSQTFATQLQNIVKRLDELNGHYLQAIKHIADVSQPALGFLPKRFETLKKSIKLAKQVPAEVAKIRDFEYERIESLKYSLLHFFNAKMYLHAKALELYSAAYETLRQISVRNEFRHVDQNTLRQIFASNPHVQATPRGGGGSNSARQNSAGDMSSRGHPSPQQRQPQPNARPNSHQPASGQQQRSQQAASQQQPQRTASAGQQRAPSAGASQQMRAQAQAQAQAGRR